MSESQADFDDALARAFANIGTANKDNKGSFGSYADLASVTEAIRGPLTDEGFSWPQTVAMEEGLVVVTTRLRRKGVELTSVLPMPVGKTGAHAIGSAITYARRYALSAMVGVCPDDDDGQGAQDSGGGGARRPAATTRPAPEPRGPTAEWTAAFDRYKAVASRRGELIKEHGLRSYMGQAERAASALGVDEMPSRLDVNPAQWSAIIDAFASDVADIVATVAAESAERSDALETIAQTFDGIVEDASGD